MGTSVSLRTSSLAVEPGQTVSTELRVRNTGEVVDQLAFQPLGDGAPWITVEPPAVRLFPDSDEVVTVTFAPPRAASTRSGVTSWAVKAVPQEDPGGAAVAEGTLDVGTFVDVGAELQPVTGRGRLSGRFDVAVDNRSNLAVPVRLAGTDSEQSLGFAFDPVQFDTVPGAAHFAKLKIRPATRIWRGQPRTHPFQVVVEPQIRAAVPAGGAEDEPPPAPAAAPIVLNGSLLQEPILPSWLLKAVLALIAVMIALFILWKTVLKPQVESAARAVAIEEVAEVEDQVEELAPAVAEAAEQAEQAQEVAAEAEQAAADAEEAVSGGGGDGGGDGGGGGGGGGVGGILDETSAPANFRLEVTAPAGTDGAGASTPPNPPGTTFALTDLILQNPGGDVGRIRVVINGSTILESALENFRDLDFHFVAPYVVEPGQSAAIELDCDANQILVGDPCDVAASFAGFSTTITEPEEG